jgi:hypothetical protein
MHAGYQKKSLGNVFESNIGKTYSKQNTMKLELKPFLA